MKTSNNSKFKQALKSLLFSLMLMLVISPQLQAANFYSLRPGTWTDVVNVWSRDGINACNCSPATQTLSLSDSIYVRHALSFTNMISLAAYTEIRPQGQLTGTNFVEINGELHNLGYLECDALQINISGYLDNRAPLTLTSGDLNNEGGIVDLQGSILINGSVNNLMSGTINILPNTTIGIANNILNRGNINLNGNNCIQVGGMVYNNTPGFMNGTGYIEAPAGINNQGFWSFGVNWCSASNATGMPMPPSCGTCMPLPVTLLSFTGSVQGTSGEVNLSWTTTQENGVSGFLIEKSRDGQSFSALGEVPAVGVSGKQNYQLTDPSILSGSIFYRLSEVSQDGHITQLKTIEIKSAGLGPDFSFEVFPNPFAGQLNFRYQGNDEADLQVALFDLSGKVMLEKRLNAVAPGTQLDLQSGELAAGFYLLRINGAGQSFSKRIMKK